MFGFLLIGLNGFLYFLLGGWFNLTQMPWLFVLAAIYCCLHARVSFLQLFLAGILMDVLLGNTLGVHALIFMFYRVLLGSDRRLVCLYAPVFKQLFMVFVMLVLYGLFMVGVLYWQSGVLHTNGLWALFTSVFLWFILKTIQRR